LLPFLLRYFSNLLIRRFMFLLSLDSAISSLSSSLFYVLVFKAIFFTFFSLDSCSFSLSISISSSLSLPNNSAVVVGDRFLDYKMVVSLGCQLLSRHFTTLLFSSSLSNSFPKPIRWLTMCVNIFCTAAIDSPCCILNNTYSWIKHASLLFSHHLFPHE